MGKRKYFVCSVGEPGKDYVEENLNRIIKQKGFVLHEDTKQKGAFKGIEAKSVLILKYNRLFIGYGEVSEVNISDEAEWNHWAYVHEWHFYNSANPKEGIERYGIDESTLEGGKYGTVKEVDANFAFEKIEKINKSSSLFTSLLKEINQNRNNTVMEYYINLLLENKNLVLTGAPGTGKTYLAKKIAEQITESQITSEFTPEQLLQDKIDSFQSDKIKSDALELKRSEFLHKFPFADIKNIQLDDYCVGTGDSGNFCWWMENGLKDLGRFWPAQRGSYVYGVFWNDEAKEYKINKNFEPEKNPEKVLIKILEVFENAINDEQWLENSSNTALISNGFLLKVLYTYSPEVYFPVNGKQHIDNIIKLFDITIPPKSNIFQKNKAIMDFFRLKTKGKDISPLEFMEILYNNFNIADGEIKENQKIVIKGKIEFVQFHPSYDYTDFIEGLRPIKKANNELGFELRDGIFKSLCVKAIKNPNKNYALIIDEINRSEISKVFGELFFSIDPGYRGTIGRVKTQYANLIPEGDVFEEGMYVPDNVYIIGTMNDIDRSVESFDFAMRRRFTWVEIKAEDRIEMLDALGEDVKNKAANKLKAINHVIYHENGDMEAKNIEGLNASFHIGPAYFLKLEKLDYNFDQLWNYHLEPLIKEYLRGLPNATSDLKSIKEAYQNG